MRNAPQIKPNGSVNAALFALLVNGFNTQSVSSATASGGVATFNFATAPGFGELDTVAIEGASNSAVNGKWRVLSAASNQVLVSIPGLADGALGGTILMKFAPLGWTRPFDEPGVGAYRMGGSASHKRFVRVYDNTLSSASAWYHRCYEDMTAISTGTNPYPTTTERVGNGQICYIFGSANASPWFIVGTPRFIYFGVDAQGALFPEVPPRYISGKTPSPHSLIFGELDRIQKVGDTYAQVVCAPTSAVGYMARAANGVNNSRPTMEVLGAGVTGTFSGLNAHPDPVSGNLLLEDAARVDQTISSQRGVRGYFPGMLTSPGASMRVAPYTNNWCTKIFTGFSGVMGRVIGLNIPSDEYFLRLDEDWGDV
jgi:hypothetical protein